MRESPHTRVIFHAAQLKGGTSALADALGVSVTDLQAWMRSEVPIPARVYSDLLDVIAEDTLSKLTTGGRTDNSGSQGASS